MPAKSETKRAENTWAPYGTRLSSSPTYETAVSSPRGSIKALFRRRPQVGGCPAHADRGFGQAPRAKGGGTHPSPRPQTVRGNAALLERSLPSTGYAFAAARDRDGLTWDTGARAPVSRRRTGSLSGGENGQRPTLRSRQLRYALRSWTKNPTLRRANGAVRPRLSEPAGLELSGERGSVSGYRAGRQTPAYLRVKVCTGC